MGSINVRNSGTLFFDFRYQGVRCREYTSLNATATNRKKLQRVLETLGTTVPFACGRKH